MSSVEDEVRTYHIAVEATVTVKGHLELEEEDLVGAGKALWSGC